MVVGVVLAWTPALAAATYMVPHTCTTPTTGTNLGPNRPCWVAGTYNNDYANNGGMADTGYYTQAGGHPFVGVTDFQVTGGQTKSVRVDIPAGLISNPQATPKCSDSQLTGSGCLADTQLGVVELHAAVVNLLGTYIGESVYNMQVESTDCPGAVAEYAFNVPVAGATYICGFVDSATDDHLYFTIQAPASAALESSTLIFWGVPGDSGHNHDRGWSCLNLLGPCTPPMTKPGTPSGKPFITLPSGCLPAGQSSTLRLVDTSSDQAEETSNTPVAATGCGDVPFNPSLTVKPATTQSDAPTGLNVDLHVPQADYDTGVSGANDLASATLQDASVTLPPGMTLDPSAANGLRACSPAQFGKGSNSAPTCPAASRVGTVTIDTPVLASPLTGTVYLGCDGSSAQTPCPASTGLAYLYVYATGDNVTQKLMGTVHANSITGQLTTTFSDQPQVPFQDLILTFKSGSTAPIANPLQCGQATTTTALTPYSGNAAATPTSAFTVDWNGAGGSCPNPVPFTPGLTVAPQTSQAGAFDRPLTFTITRADQQYLSKITLALPPGLTGLIARVPRCPNAQAGSGACPASSQIGTTTVLAGSGSDPITQSGPVYLTDSYAGAPFGLSIVVPAISGPFDLGTVITRAAIEVDKNDAHLTVVSDPLPQVVGGVPLRIRAVEVSINHAAFTLNPTNCSSFATTGTFGSVQGALASAQRPFQATDCGALPFKPGLKIALSGKGQTTSGKHPTLTATVTSGLGQANIRSTSVTLPRSLALDPNNSEHVCSVAASASDSCPASTAIGSATVDTPLLNQPLTGTVYLVQGIRYVNGQPIRTLPALLIPLRGQVALDLRAQTSVSNGALVTTFPAVPDAAVSSFTLRIAGGRRGILVVTGRGRSLCSHGQVAQAALGAQSGASQNLALPLPTPCLNRATVSGLEATHRTIRLTVTVPAAGSLKVGGPGLRPQSRRLRQATTASFVLRLTGAAAARLRRDGRLRIGMRIRYSRTGGGSQMLVIHLVTMRP